MMKKNPTAIPRVIVGLLVLGLIPSEASAAIASFDTSSGRPTVELTVNGKGPFPFVLDTGAPDLMVLPALVAELDLEVLGTTKINSPVGGTPVEARQVRVESIALGDAVVRDLVAIELDLSGANLGMGVVGPAVFREHGPAMLDFGANTVALGEDAKRPDTTAWIPFGPSAPLLDVSVEIGDLRIDGHIDSGSPGTLAVPDRFAERLPLTGPMRTVGRARTIDAEFEIRAAPIEAIVRIGDASIPLREVHLAPLPVANLGTEGLRGLSLYVDWENARFTLSGQGEATAGPSARADAAAADGPRFGLSGRPTADGAIEVIGTEAGSAAETIGLVAGDRILAINDLSPGDLDVTGVRRELSRPDAKLTVERDNRTIELARAKPPH